jgi:hypothetical protein
VALLSYYSPSVVNIRPAQAAEMLPANNPKLSGQKLGAALYQYIQVLRFFGDTAALGRYESMLKFVQDRNSVTRTEIETYYRNNIRALIISVVDEKARGKTVSPATILDIKQIISNFFLTPNQTTFLALKEKYPSRNVPTWRLTSMVKEANEAAEYGERMGFEKTRTSARQLATNLQQSLNIRLVLMDSLETLNLELAKKIEE